MESPCARALLSGDVLFKLLDKSERCVHGTSAVVEVRRAEIRAGDEQPDLDKQGDLMLPLWQAGDVRLRPAVDRCWVRCWEAHVLLGWLVFVARWRWQLVRGGYVVRYLAERLLRA